MTWKARNAMDERVKFIARFLEGEKVARLAVEYGISRQTAYKVIERHQDAGPVGLTDPSRRVAFSAGSRPCPIGPPVWIWRGRASRRLSPRPKDGCHRRRSSPPSHCRSIVRPRS